MIYSAAFLAAGFLVVVLAAGFLAAGLAALAAGLAPAALAILTAAALRREAVFFFIRSFLTALSYSDWSLARFSAVGLALNALRADLIARLISWLCSVCLTAWRAAFLADLIIGM